MSNEQPDLKQLVESKLLQMKKQTSQIKGEFTDSLTEAIANNFTQFYQISQQLTGQLTQKDGEIANLKKQLLEYETAHPELKIAKEKKPTKK